MKYLKLFEYFDDDFEPLEEEEYGDFYEWLLKKYPDQSSWKDIKEIDCSNSNLYDLDGIEFLTNLTNLYCYDNQLTDLDLSKNVNLTCLYCSHNQLTNKNEIRKLCKKRKINLNI